MDANKIKFERAQGPLVDDDGSIEVLFAKQTEPKAIKPPMTARVHAETLTDELIPQDRVLQETTEEESSSDEDIVVISSSVEGVIEGVSDASGPVSITEEIIEKVVEQHIKELEKMESVILCLGSGIASSIEPSLGEQDAIKSDEVKVPVCFANGAGGDEDQDMKREEETKEEEEVIDKEALSLVANAVNDVREDERVPISPKGCCILQ